MPSNSNSPAQHRTGQKLRYAQIHLDELIEYRQATSNDEWENAHQESFFYHLAGALDAFLHEINDAYSLGLELNAVRFEDVEKRLKTVQQPSPAFDLLEKLWKDKMGWLFLLRSWRNHGTHRGRVAKRVNMSNWQRVDNEFTVPETGRTQTVYPGAGCKYVMTYLARDANALIDECRKLDVKL